ncbi:DNA polymerase III subunit alpha [Candidatus Kaiserbacteria bacterium RIFCSPLOWO2_01_FULL_51_21]|uniref:DNA polymerase III subunit alpha n=1 Tax=Candidatus Kaiserbacteria bacterium RIFCSPLOWO2_01_FULL_51_21 TaxID=1798508 RepID=A0A1F6ECD2_9BACT|nr:MAG: DNA polymerase III subunit alpha [Candidatus Kaiserbacteria bacterium RIFCSPLOWO2_01_FULL_51_21]
MADFIHLHTHSHYSLLSALPKIPELIRAAASSSMRALALTDEGNLYGAIEFYKECKNIGLKPIIGLTVYLAPRTRFDKEPSLDGNPAKLLLLSKNEVGYKNLLSLVTASHLEGFFEKPRVDHELLASHCEGIIAIIPAMHGKTSRMLLAHNAKGALEELVRYKNIFGSENLFLEISHHPEIPGHTELIAQIAKLSAESNTPLIAAHEVYYLKPEDRAARKVLLRIQQNSREDFKETEEDFSFIDTETALRYFSEFPSALENTLRVAESCNLSLELGKWIFPDYPLPQGTVADEELRRQALAGLPSRGFEKTEEIMKRIDYELGIIAGKGFSAYFLVVADLLRFARSRRILTTTRGSAAGSLVSYLTGVTNVDPLRFKLPFERFLNPERPKAPDIDMDFADNRRDEVIDYVRQKYGEDRVAQIGTFGTMMARAAVRDIARASGHPYRVGDSIAKLIPFGSQGFPMSIERALKITPELSELYKKDPVSREVIDLAQKIEGNARHISVHAAGVVIAPTPLVNYTPLQFDPKGGKLITQYDMYALTDEYGGVGLLKFDFLGIKNLAILADSVRLVKEFHGAEIDIETVPLDERKTFEMLARGETEGLFQLNGSGMTHFLKELRPTSINDINAMVALYRPGPMETIPQYIERKHNPRLVQYLDPRLREVLADSYGVITYQDDVLLIAVTLAGYSWLEADALRKAMGKKIPAEMEAQKEKLKRGFVEHGKLSSEKAEKLWRLIEPFAAYGFNKAHAASYGKVAYQTAYMKANFPVEYMAALLTADAGDVEKIAESVTECKRMGIPVLPPEINESFGDFTVIPSVEEPWKIRFGLRSIKNFGEGIAGTIIAEREKNGKFKTLGDFLERIHDKNLNKKSLESLIKCGALDAFEERGVSLQNLDELLAYNRMRAETSESQHSLFGALPESKQALHLEKGEPVPMRERLAWEKELLGLYVSGHPLDAYKEKLAKQGTTIASMKSENREGAPTVVAGVVEEAKRIMTKNGEYMAFVRLADLTSPLEVVFFPRVFKDFKSFLEPERVIAIKGRVSNRNGDISLIAEAVKEL